MGQRSKLKVSHFFFPGKYDLPTVEQYQALLSQMKEDSKTNANFVEIKMKIENIERLLSDWVSVEKDIQANKYGLSKMLVKKKQFFIHQRTFHNFKWVFVSARKRKCTQ